MPAQPLQGLGPQLGLNSSVASPRARRPRLGYRVADAKGNDDLLLEAAVLTNRSCQPIIQNKR